MWPALRLLGQAARVLTRDTHTRRASIASLVVAVVALAPF